MVVRGPYAYDRRMVGRAPAERLLDRGTELDTIAAVLRAAGSGSGTALLVEGAAGIGKTRLLTHACDRAAHDGMTVLAARAAEFEGGYAWGVVRQLFEPGVQAGDGQQLHGDAAALAAPAFGYGTPRGEEDSFSILHGLYWLTATIAQRAPLLLAVDDLHWSDRPSLRFVVHLARRLEGLPVVLLVTVREPRSATGEDPALTASLAAEVGVTVLRPAALSMAACAGLVRGALGADPSPGFQQACREITGGNPLLLRALLDSLAAEGARGTDGEIPHLRRLTPSAVSRRVLLQLGRLPAGALAAARAVAVLGTAATAGRAGRLAGLDADTCAEAIAALMAERLVEGERALMFVHPLVRSAVYQDLAPPLRQRWHLRAARMLAADGAPPEEVTVHLLATGGAGDPWVVDRLRQAAADARGRGAPDVARLCLERALAEPPSAEVRADVLFELGSVATIQAPATAVGQLTEALGQVSDPARRGTIALALSEALALGGRFADAVEVLATAIAELDGGHQGLATSLQAALLNIARWDLGTRPVTLPLLEELQERAGRGEELDPQLHANLAIELAAAGADRNRAVGHAREAVRATPRLISVTSTALPETVSVLLFADLGGEAREGAQAWLRLAQERGWPLSSAVAASVASLIALYCGDVSEAAAYGQQALEGTGDVWISSIAAAFLVHALIDRDACDEAYELLTARGLTGELVLTWPYVVVRHARGCLRAATGERQAAAQDLLRAGELAERWGIRNPAMMGWRSAAALSLNVLGDAPAAARLCAEEVALARRWGSARALGIALRAAGVVAGGAGGIELLTEAVTVLRPSMAALELARALIDLGSAHRRAGSRTLAREFLREGLHTAYALGGAALADRARHELVVAGSRPRRDALRGRDALTPSELRVAQMAAAGQTNRQIAQALFVTQRTVENHLTSTYSKLGISSRPELPAALDGSARRSPGNPRG
jgi:DNA-binding CsgD family transcriptional regulator/tetratricopeptide (TPR) repeat protein